jgi:hypothetical protein
MGYLRSTYVAPFFTKHIFPKHYLIYTFLLAISSWGCIGRGYGAVGENIFVGF